MKRSFFISHFFLLMVLFSILTVVGSFIDKSKKGEVKNSQIKYPSTQPSLISSTPTPQKTIQLLDTPTPTPVSPTDQFTYPNSQKTGGNTYSTTDSPQVVTNWYKNKFEELNLNVTSLVQTSSNDNVLNKLSGANGSIEISVEITRRANDTTTKIVLYQ